MDRERITKQLAEVTRDRLGRFARLEFLRTCDPIAGCGVDSDLAAAIEGVDAFLETVETLVLVTEPSEAQELAQIVRDYRRTLRDDLERLEEFPDEGDPAVLRREPERRAPLWVEGLGVGEYMDVTGLSGKEAATLALVLNAWTNGGKKRSQPVYRYRDGKRYIRGPSRLRVDLNHPQMAPFRDDLLAAMRDPDSAREFEVDPDALEAQPDELAAAYEANARTRAGYDPELAPRRSSARSAPEPAPAPKKAKRKKAKPAKPAKPPSTQRPRVVSIEAAENVAGEWRPSTIPAYDVGTYAVGRSLSDPKVRNRYGLEVAGGSWIIYHKRTGFGAVSVRGSRKSALAAAWGFDRIAAELGDAGKFGTTDGIGRQWLGTGSSLAASIDAHKGPLSYDQAETYARAAIARGRKD